MHLRDPWYQVFLAGLGLYNAHTGLSHPLISNPGLLQARAPVTGLFQSQPGMSLNRRISSMRSIEARSNLSSE